MEGVRVGNCVPFTSNLHSVSFINIKFHLPGEFPLGYRIKASLQKGGITVGFDAAVEGAIISMKRWIVMASSGRSLMYIKNSMGPRTVPWGTPERTGWEEDCDPSETTLCDLPCRKLWIQVCVCVDPLMPYQLSLYCRRL